MHFSKLAFVSCCTAVILAIMASGAMAAPSISSTSGTFSNGQSVTISGSSFGTKSTAPPALWDNFESGTVGTNVGGNNPVIGPTWSASGSGSVRPQYSSTGARTGSTKSSLHDYNSTSDYNVSLDYTSSASTIYLTFWWNSNQTGTQWSPNTKPWVAYGSGGTYPEAYIGYDDPANQSGGLRNAAQDNGGIAGTTLWGGTDIVSINNEWIRYEVYLVESSPDVSDGTWLTWVHRPYAASPSIVLDLNGGEGTYKTRITSNYWNRWEFGSYFAHYDHENNLVDAHGTYKLDDIYFDTTRARVEIGNASTWSGCTHREIQIPSSWSSSSITSTVNLGSFTSGTAYLYVVDSAGAVNSSGYAITVGGGGGLPTVSIDTTDASASEAGSNTGTFRVTRTGSTSSALAVTYSIGGTASSGDYTPTLSGTVTISSGSSTADITITPVDDSSVEGSETVILAITSSANYNIGSPSNATVTIADNDGPSFIQSAGLVADAAASSIAASFGSNTATGNAVVVAVTWDTSAGSTLSSCSDSQGHTYTVAVNQTDTGNSQAIAVLYYVGTTAAADTVTVNFSNGSASYRAIAIHEYSNVASASPVDGTAYNVATGTNVTSNSATTTVNGDLIFGVSRTNGGGGPTVTPGSGFTKREDRSSPSRMVTEDKVQATAGSVAATFTYSQSWAYLCEMVALKPTGAPGLPTVTITATDASASEAGPDAGTFTVSRTGATTSALGVNYAISGTAASGDYTPTLSGTVTIASGSSTAAITITPVDDANYEGSETLILTISSNANYTVGSPSNATVTIADNDKPTVTVTAPDAAAAEAGQDPGTFRFSRTGITTSALAVSYAISGTASSGDYTPTLSGTVTIASGSATADITITPVDDATSESSETVILTINTNANYTVGAPSNATVTITDNDTLPTVTVTATDANASETGSDTGTFTVSRTGSTSGSLVVNYAMSGTATNGTDYSNLSGSVTINSGSATATVVVTPVNDQVVEGSETAILTISANASYTVGSPSNATVTIADNDTLVVNWGASSGANVFGITGWSTVNLGLYRTYSSDGPDGINGGTTSWNGWQCVSGSPNQTFSSGDKIVVTWYNGGASQVVFTPKVSFTRNGDGQSGTWYNMNQVTLAAGATGTSTYTIDAGSAGSYSLVNICHMKDGAASLLCDKVEWIK